MEVVTVAVAIAMAADSEAEAAVSCEACGHTLSRLAGAVSSSGSKNLAGKL